MAVLTFNFADYFVYMLTAPADNRGIGLQTLTPQGIFILKWNLAIIGGFILSIPVITIQVWKFVSPGLYNRERKNPSSINYNSILMFFIRCYFCLHGDFAIFIELFCINGY